MTRANLLATILLMTAVSAGAETTKLVYALPTGSSAVIPHIALDSGFY